MPTAVPASAHHGERRQVTIAFCDLVDSTTLASSLDPEDYRDVMRAYHALADEIVGRHGGVVSEYLGDGVVAVFGFPHAREDDAARAGRAALELLERVVDIAAGAVRLRARVGIETGVVVVGEMARRGVRIDANVVGDTVSLAARLQALADPGSVVVGPTTRLLLEGWAECDALGPHMIKGFAEPIDVFRLRATTTAEARFDAATRRGLLPLVGRETELQLLLDRKQTVDRGDGAVVVVTGEPGIGKSRLIHALLDKAGVDAADVIELRGSADHAATPLWPVTRQLAALGRDEIAGIAAASKEPEAAALVAELLDPQRRDVGGPEAGSRLARLLTVLRDWIAARGRARPTVVLFEDVHWADATTRELLTVVVDRGPMPGLLVVVAARPDLETPWPPYSHVLVLTLSRLDPSAARLLVEHTAGDETIAPRLVDDILARSEGVPLHLEEFARWAVAVAHERRSDSAVPATLHDSLMARLDPLGPVRVFAQYAAVLGRDVDVDLLAAVVDRDVPAARAALDALVTAGLLLPRGPAPHQLYRFRHALLRDAAYASLLRAERRSIHHAVAETLVALRPDIADEDPELLARHFDAAGDAERAAHFWRRAARRAERRSAVTEAIACFTRAIELTRELPPSDDRDRAELRMLLLLAPLVHRREFAPDRASVERARELADRVGSPYDRVTARNMSWGLAVRSGDLPSVRRATDELRRAADDVGDPLVAVLGRQADASTSLYEGDLDRAEHAAAAAVALYQPEFHAVYTSVGSHDPGLVAVSELALCHWLRGRVDTAQRTIDGALERVAPPVHPYAVALTSMDQAAIAWRRRDAVLARAAAERAVEVASEHELEVIAAPSCWLLGWATAALGDAELGLELAEDGEQRFRNVVFANAEAHLVLGEILLQLARYDAALAAIESGRAHALGPRSLRTASDLCRLEAEVRHARDPGDPLALESARQAVALAGPSPSLQLRSLTTLVRLAPHDASARAVLASCHARVTEGLASDDVRAAAAALERADG